MPKNSILRIYKSDSVAVALRPINKGQILDIANSKIKATEDIGVGHKIAVRDIAKGEDIIKYGASIGHATMPIRMGSLVHTHNLTTNLSGLLDYTYEPQFQALWSLKPHIPTFSGYLRPNGDVGVRNEVWIINTVGCVNKVAERLVHSARQHFKGRKVDGIHIFSHPYGCSQLGDDHKNTQNILAGLVNHPNAGGVLVLGLGCENNNIEEFKKVLRKRRPIDSNRIKFLNTQDVEDEQVVGMEILEGLVSYAEGFVREEVPISKLKIGLKCGGSDAFSGITGNPLLGAFSDALVSQGATTILTEVPEMFGAETILMNRCVTEEVYEKCVTMINNFKEYFIRYDQVIYENPSPGNKEGGITTLEEKSLGCTQKGGTGKVVDVVDMETVTVPGLNLLDGPGNDIVAVTALVASGAHMVLFTTGRGTPLGGPVPTVKVSTNSELAKKKKHWIDFDAGILLEDGEMGGVSRKFFEYIIDVASGRMLAKNEERDFREIAIFKDGVTL